MMMQTDSIELALSPKQRQNKQYHQQIYNLQVITHSIPLLLPTKIHCMNPEGDENDDTFDQLFPALAQTYHNQHE